ncbi:hypothetical protein [Nocardia sp. IFM 10818]
MSAVVRDRKGMALTRFVRELDTRESVLVLLSGFVAIWALAGALGLVTGVIDLGPTISDRLPFDSPVFGGIALAVVVGLPMTLTAVFAARADARTPELAMLSGGMLICWIIVQVYTIRVFVWLQPVCVALGLAVLALGMTVRPGARSSR